MYQRFLIHTFLPAVILVLCNSQTVPSAASQPSKTEFEALAAPLIKRSYLADKPGAAVLVVRGDEVLLRTARGLADYDSKKPLGADALFRIGSVTKQMTAAGLLLLVEGGKVRLEDPISKYVPDIPDGDRITLHQLLNHTSGVRNFTNLPGYVDEVIRRDMNTRELIDLFRKEKSDFAPGTNWSYSNSGYILIGAVIESVAGKPWHTYLADVLFRPLGMTNTGYGHDPLFSSRQVKGHSYHGAEVVPMKAMSMTHPHGAGAIVSCLEDLHRWNRALHEGRVLKNETYQKMITPVGPAAGVGNSYGYGVQADMLRTSSSLYHGGRIFGYASLLTYVPGADISVVVLENNDSSEGPESSYTLTRRLAALAMGDPYPEHRTMTVEPAQLKEAEGVYRFAGDVIRIVRVVEGALTAQRDRGPRRLLSAISKDDYLYEDGFNRFKLERDGSGKIKSMRFYPKGDGPGEIGLRTEDPLPAEPVGLKLSKPEMERVTGDYSRGGMKMRVFVKGDTLMAQLAGQDPVTLRAMSSTRFDVVETAATLEFSAVKSKDSGSTAPEPPADEVTLKQNGREMILKRVP
ncbi:MAG: serine hydrolase domain-containing protein [Planctomycetota bacterium]